LIEENGSKYTSSRKNQLRNWNWWNKASADGADGVDGADGKKLLACKQKGLQCV